MNTQPTIDMTDFNVAFSIGAWVDSKGEFNANHIIMGSKEALVRALFALATEVPLIEEAINEVADLLQDEEFVNSIKSVAIYDKDHHSE